MVGRDARRRAIEAFRYDLQLPDRVTASEFLPLAFFEPTGGIEEGDATRQLESILRAAGRNAYWFVPIAAIEASKANEEAILIPEDVTLAQAFNALDALSGRGFDSGSELARYGFVDPDAGWSIYVDRCSLAVVSVTATLARSLVWGANRRLLRVGSLGTAKDVLANPGVQADLAHCWDHWEHRFLAAYA